MDGEPQKEEVCSRSGRKCDNFFRLSSGPGQSRSSLYTSRWMNEPTNVLDRPIMKEQQCGSGRTGNPRYLTKQLMAESRTLPSDSWCLIPATHEMCPTNTTHWILAQPVIVTFTAEEQAAWHAVSSHFLKTHLQAYSSSPRVEGA